MREQHGNAGEADREYQRAFELFSQHESLDSGDCHGFALLARQLYEHEEYEKARVIYDKLLDLDGQQPKWWAWRGMARHYLKDHAGAIADLSRAVELNPERSEYWNLIGFPYRSTQQLDAGA